MQIHDVVALTRDVPGDDLWRGQVGTIVEEWRPGLYEVEFSDLDGRTYAMAAVQAEALIALHFKPVDRAA